MGREGNLSTSIKNKYYTGNRNLRFSTKKLNYLESPYFLLGKFGTSNTLSS